jgi:diguanylate cyclase (GGDEF)-like protein/putative nucleotidyltransferase with HDIG domain
MLPPPPRLPVHGRVYVLAVIVFGFAVVSYSVYQLTVQPIGYQWFLLMALTLVSGSATVKLPSVPASISISETFVFTAVLLYGTAAGTLTVALDGLVISYWMAKRRREQYRAWFNMSAPAVSVWLSANLFFSLSDIDPVAAQPGTLDGTLNQILPSLFLFAVTYFGLNSGLIALAISIETRLSPVRVWWNNFAWLSLNYFCGASVAVLLVFATPNVDIRFLGLILPLLLVLYFTFRTSMARVEDANKHVEQVNQLYLSTIETLAMAIDAKDQITHGHIRRVQTYAVGLARRLGVTDVGLIKAIEAAALLHDMGKLAVPEHILNKPGKLTDSEFEKMKLHASVGADILSAIDFPYPVVPIVRHHHEQWDGGGYPAGLAGTDIPIGARILSVVDCFDALTSDRPYRVRLSDADAIGILIERKGTLYDPLVVDTFVRVHNEIAQDMLTSVVPKQALREITGSMQQTSALIIPAKLEDIANSAHEMLALFELATGIAGQASFNDTAEVITNHVRRLVPFTQSVMFVYDPVTDELDGRHAVGDASASLRGLRIPLGQRISGWVAVNRQTAMNSDPTLDLGDVARSFTPRLSSSICTPVIHLNELVGVLSLYSQGPAAFGEDDKRVIEIIAQHIGYTLKCAIEFDGASKRDLLTGLPNLKQLEKLMESASTNGLTIGVEATLLFIDVVGFRDLNNSHGRQAGDEVLKHVVRFSRTALRVADILFRYGGDEFVALLNRTSPDTARMMADHIRQTIAEHRLMLRNGEIVQVMTDIVCVSSPSDGTTLRELINSARLRLSGRRPRLPTHVH